HGVKPKPKEHEIEQRLRYLSGVLQVAPDAIVSTDAHMNVVMWNPGAERLFGYSSEEAAGRNIDDLITNADIRAEALQYSEITMSQEHLFHAETARCRKDGALVDVLLSAAPILVQGNHIGSVAIYTDITERKQTEQALHAAKAAAQQQRRRAESLQEVAAVLSSSLERDTVLSKIMEQLGRVVAYDGAGILLLEGDSLVVSGGSESVQPFLGKRFAITGQGPDARLYQERRTIIIDDVHHDPHWETWPGIENIRSWIGQQVIGVLTLDSYTIAAYTEKDAELFQTFAHQAALAIKNARLFETERAALEQAETLYAASLALSATMDLQQVLERILAQLRDVAPYDSASVQQWVGDHMEVIAGAGYKKFAHMIGVRYDAHDELNQELIAKRAPMIIEDAREYPVLKTADQSRHGIRGWLAAPLLFGERLIGKITLDHHEPGFYTQEHANRAMAFATQAAIAIENARLYSQAQAELAERKQAEEGLRQQRNYLSALHDTALALLNRLEIGDLLDNILAHAKRLLNVEIGEIALVTTRGESVQLVSGVGNAQQPLDTSRGLDGLVWRTGEVQIVPDYAAWELRRPEPQYDVIHGAVGLPLKIGAAVVGIMTLGATELARQFTAEEVELLEQFARLAALAIDNARLFDETQQAKQAADTLRAAYLDLSQSLELDLICEKLLDWLKKFTPYDSATIFLLEGDTRLVARAVRGYEAWGVLDQARTAAFEIESASGVAAVITGQKSRLIPDVTQDPRWIGVASAAHVRAWLGVPMMSGGKVIGVCSLDSAQTNFFEPEHVQLAESLAIQAAFAIQNAASYDEARQARKVAEAASQAKSIFLAKMSHELHTPVDSILSFG
ncbi:MAG: GAF domain-containing protein, partial [Anaerolineales bacterium]